MNKSSILVLDQGTTNLKALVFDSKGQLLTAARQKTCAIFPQPGWVEQDPMVVMKGLKNVSEKAIEDARTQGYNICGIGITNQTESIVLWDRVTGDPVYNVITWQCQRTADFCEQLNNVDLRQKIQQKTGLPLAPTFSASKIRWVFEHVPGVFERAKRGEILAGSLDTWVAWNLSEGRLHITDTSNASRTMLFNINSGNWDEELLEIFNIPSQILPDVKPSSEIYGYCKTLTHGGYLPICAMIGDQQSSLFGQGCLAEGDVKVTYGTGAFLYLNLGSKPIFSKKGLTTTVAWELNGKITYALEGFVQTAGAVVQWLSDGLQLIESPEYSEMVANEVKDSKGLYFVPALTGSGSPLWDPDARGLIIGITPGTKQAHIVRAALEGICFQVRDVVEVMMKETNRNFTWLRADGGATQNNLLMQIQADILGFDVKRFGMGEATALGAAKLAGSALGIWDEKGDIKGTNQFDRTFHPCVDKMMRERKYSMWKQALSRSGKWARQ